MVLMCEDSQVLLRFSDTVTLYKPGFVNNMTTKAS